MALERKLHAKEDLAPTGASTEVDPVFLFLVLLLLAVGLIMLYSASSAQSRYDTGYQISTKYLQKQGICALIGLAAMAFFSRIPAQVWYRLAWPLYTVSIVLLLSVLVIGQQVNGARRWITIAGIQFQPSEIAKLTTIIFLADWLATKPEKNKKFMQHFTTMPNWYFICPLIYLLTYV